MTPETQREALAVLAELCALSPEIRIGQLCAHLGFLGEVCVGKNHSHIDDDEMIAVMYRHRSELLARLKTADHQSPLSIGADASVSGSSTRPEMTTVTGKE